MTKTQARDVVKGFFYGRGFCPPRLLYLAEKTLGTKEALKLERQVTQRRIEEIKVCSRVKIINEADEADHPQLSPG